MTIKVEIKNPEVTTFSGVSKRTGQPFSIRKMEGWCHTGKAYPERMEINLRDDQAPYTPGLYTLSQDSIYVDRNGRLAITPRLVPASPQTAQAVHEAKKSA